MKMQHFSHHKNILIFKKFIIKIIKKFIIKIIEIAIFYKN